MSEVIDEAKVYRSVPDGYYLVDRTSAAYYEKPYDSAIPIRIIRVDTRTVDDPAKVPMYEGKSDWWYHKGTRHRIENGNICRDMDAETRWAARVDDMLAFVREHGRCIVSIGQYGPEIEIYDDYRE